VAVRHVVNIGVLR